MYKHSGSFRNVMEKFLVLFLCGAFLYCAVPAFRNAAAEESSAGNMTKAVNTLLIEEASKMKDAWQKAVLESGIDQLSVDGNKVTFLMRSFDPKTKSLGAYAKAQDPSAWLMSALKNASSYDLEITLETDGGTFTPKSLKSFRSSVQKASAAAKKAFGGKEIAAALKNYLFPAPVSGKVRSASDLSSPDPSFSAWYSEHADLLGNAPVEVAVAAFYLQKSQAFNVKDGPHAITLTCVGAPLSGLVDNSIRAVTDTQAYLPLSSRSDAAGLENELKSAFLSTAFPELKKAKDKTELTLDLDDLMTGELPASYRQYFSSFSWDTTVYSLSSALNELPDSAAKELPKPGVLSGNNKGTKVIFKISDESNPTYIIMRDANTDSIAVTAMALPGKSVTLRVPQGFYYIAWCSGPYWYGDQELFSSLGVYNKSERVEILGGRYYHTFKLVKTTKGNTSVYGANPDDFR